MSRLKDTHTLEGFAKQLSQADQSHLLTQPAFTAPTTTLGQWSNQSSASNPQNADFVLGWGSTEYSTPFRGLNGSYAQASVHFSVSPQGNRLHWVALKNS